MSLRIKFIVALLLTSVVSVAVVGAVAYDRLQRRFDDITLARSSRNFAGDVAAYWMTYGSWEAGRRIETFRNFVQRRKSLIVGRDVAPEEILRGALRNLDTGGPLEAKALEPLAADPSGPVGQARDGGRPPPPQSPGSLDRQPPPFLFLLFDVDGRVLNPVKEVGRQASEDERRKAVPIQVGGRIVAFASPSGAPNYTDTERSYLAALRNALLWGVAAAVPLAIGVGLFLGYRLSRSLERLHRAIAHIEDGELGRTVAVEGNDEVGALARRFNAMSAALARSHQELEASHVLVSQQAEQLRRLADLDALTGLANRRHFDDRAPGMLAEARRSGMPLCLAVADIDNFKQINDAFSHAVGDEVLRIVGQILGEGIRDSDVAVRFGGEEFVILLAGSGGPQADMVCERLRAAIEAYPWSGLQQGLKVTISVGIAADTATGSLQELFARADRQLYGAKASGRNRVRREQVAPAPRVA